MLRDFMPGPSEPLNLWSSQVQGYLREIDVPAVLKGLVHIRCFHNRSLNLGVFKSLRAWF